MHLKVGPTGIVLVAIALFAAWHVALCDWFISHEVLRGTFGPMTQRDTPSKFQFMSFNFISTGIKSYLGIST